MSYTSVNNTIYLLTFQIEEHRICVCVRARPLNKKGKSSFILYVCSPPLDLFIYFILV